VAAIRAARRADADDPTADEALGIVLAVMRGRYRRHAMARLSAARELLDRRRGRPAQAVQIEGELVHRVEIVRHDQADQHADD